MRYNAPAVLTFSLACVAVQLISMLTGGRSDTLLFSVYRSSMLSPLFYVRLFGHVLGHLGWSHLIGNLMLLLVIGPLLEEKYGTRNMIIVMAVTAVATGIACLLLMPGTQVLGASGIVFACILLASITNFTGGEVPLTFILVAVLYLGEQVYQGFFVQSNIANLAHIVGGLVGAALGFILNRADR